MSTPTDIERISYGGPTGSLQLGKHRQVIQSVGATRTLLAKESGALCLFDVATGVVYTLPTPVEGMQFEFLATVAVTSNAYKVITASITTQFLLGAVNSTKLAAGTDIFQADGTSNHVAISSNGSTTGGLIGSAFTLTAISATQWVIAGSLVGSGTLADPFAAS
jgi:hypothetical protein